MRTIEIYGPITEPQDAEKPNKQVLVKPGPPGRSASDRRCALMAKIRRLSRKRRSFAKTVIVTAK